MGQDLSLAKTAALTLTGWHFAGLGFLAGGGSEAHVVSPSSKGILRFPEVLKLRPGLDAARPCLLSPAHYPIHAIVKTKDPGKLFLKLPWGSSQE